MVLVFILCTIIIIFTLLICMTILSTIKLKIENFKLSNNNYSSTENKKIKQSQSKIAQDYRVIISLCLFDKIKWFGIHLNSAKMKKMYSKMQLEKMDLKKLEKNFKFEDLKIMKELKVEISYFKLNVKIGTEDAILTSFIVFIISTIISMLLPHTIKKYEKNKYYYEIMPLYQNANIYEIKFDSIIKVKMVHIINVIYVFWKKRRGEKNNERTSDRRTYGYSYE